VRGLGLHSPQVTCDHPSRPSERGATPFLVAHRAGNCLAELRASELLGTELVEADIRLYLGRLEVRHLRTVGPLPILWDRWQLAAPWCRRLQLRELLAATAPETELVLDLKGTKVCVAEKTLEAIVPFLGARRFTVCARAWPLLEPFAGLPVRRLHSIGTESELRRFLERFGADRLDGVSIHERLLRPDTVAALRSIADVVLTWTVNRPARASELVRLGVDGIVTDDVATLSQPGVLAPA
jgi:glycerophosphoryl diester phosphodiesterase